MKVIENITLYKCDFCKKELKRKHAMENHEKACVGNPENKRPCLNGCKFLVQKEIEYDSGVSEYCSGESVYRKGNTFYCEFHQRFMLHPKLEHKENGKWLKHAYFEDEEIEQEWMPKECKEYKYNFNF